LCESVQVGKRVRVRVRGRQQLWRGRRSVKGERGKGRDIGGKLKPKKKKVDGGPCKKKEGGKGVNTIMGRGKTKMLAMKEKMERKKRWCHWEKEFGEKLKKIILQGKSGKVFCVARKGKKAINRLEGRYHAGRGGGNELERVMVGGELGKNETNEKGMVAIRPTCENKAGRKKPKGSETRVYSNLSHSRRKGGEGVEKKKKRRKFQNCDKYG